MARVRTGLPKQRDGRVEALRALRVARRSAVGQRADVQRQIKALIVDDPSLLAVRPGEEIPFGPAWLERLDTVVARTLVEPGFRRDAFLPLPVLGLPGWWPANDDPNFYDDRAVFRPLPAASPS